MCKQKEGMMREYMWPLKHTRYSLIFKKKIYSFILCVCVFEVCLCATCVQEPMEDRGPTFLWQLGVPRGCWKQNLGFLSEEQVMLTTEPSLQSHSLTFYRICFQIPRNTSVKEVLLLQNLRYRFYVPQIFSTIKWTVPISLGYWGWNPACKELRSLAEK